MLPEFEEGMTAVVAAEVVEMGYNKGCSSKEAFEVSLQQPLILNRVLVCSPCFLYQCLLILLSLTISYHVNVIMFLLIF